MCTFINGDGVGDSEKKIGDQVGEECVQACLTYKKNVNANVNGVTVRQVQILCIILILYQKCFTVFTIPEIPGSIFYLSFAICTYVSFLSAIFAKMT